LDRTERFYRIERLLRERDSISLAEMMSRLGVSRPTVIRDLAYLRDRMGVPIVFDRARNGYHLADRRDAPRHRLPGLWLNADEIQALRVAARLLVQIEPDLLQAQLAPLEPRLRELLGEDARSAPGPILGDRVCLRAPGRRRVPEGVFQTVAGALLQNRRLRVEHRESGIGRTASRLVSVQRIVHHQDNWFVDAWCHDDESARSIALFFVHSAALAEAPAVLLPPSELARLFDGAYMAADPPGRAAACGEHWARLAFSAECAAEVARHEWHPDQRLRLLDDGRLRVDLPCGEPADWLTLALRYGRHCEVLEPPALRLLVADELMAIARRYAELG
jgi:predicted DNA-binding transcriptional regulator YafY